MNKIVCFVFILFQLNGYSQVELGQPSSQTLYLLNHLVKGHPNWEMEKVYDQGELREVVIYQYDQLFPDLLVKVDAIQRFVMQEGVYVLNILQFPSLKLEQLQNKYDSYYKNSRIGDYYFDGNFEYQRTIELVDGTASVLYQRAIFDELPDTVQQHIEQKRQSEKKTDSESCIADYYSKFKIRNTIFEVDTHGTIRYTKQNTVHEIKTLYGRMCAEIVQVRKIDDSIVLIELGNGGFEGYYMEIVVLFIDTGKHLIFDKSCMNWDDYFELSKDLKHIYYYCEYHTEQGYCYEIDLEGKKVLKRDLPNDRREFSKQGNIISLKTIPRTNRKATPSNHTIKQ